jgi:putative tryptophan/tyrosine transport system substrate-binding protein
VSNERAGKNMKTKITVLALCAMLLALCASAEAQQPTKVPRIGYLDAGSPSGRAHLLDAFRQGLRDLGYIEGKNIFIEYRYAEGKPDRLPELAAELVRLKANIIVTAGEVMIRAAKQATKTIPIVMAASPDPIGTGLISSLARPGGNITGLTTLSAELSGKRLELLKEVAPSLTRVAVLVYETDRGTASFLKELEIPAQALKVQLRPMSVQGPDNFDDAFSAMTRERAGAVIVPNHPIFTEYRRRIVELAAKSRLPAMHPQREFVEEGGLMSYGASIPDLFHRAAIYVDKILKGAKPEDLPVEQPMKFEFVINLNAAEQIGLTIPPNVLARADKVIK